MLGTDRGRRMPSSSRRQLRAAPLRAPCCAAPANDAFADAVLCPRRRQWNLGATSSDQQPASPPMRGCRRPLGLVLLTPSVSGPVASLPRLLPTFCHVAVYTGAAVNALTPVADNAGSPPELLRRIRPVRVHAVPAPPTGSRSTAATAHRGLHFTFSGAPANDASPMRQNLAPDPAARGGHAIRRRGGRRAAHVGEPGGHSVWYSWTPAVSGPVSISTCSSFFALDTLLAVYTGVRRALTPVAGNDDAPSGEGFPGCSRPTARPASTPPPAPPTGSPSTASTAARQIHPAPSRPPGK